MSTTRFQELFELIGTHLLNQGRQSVSHNPDEYEDEVCVYYKQEENDVLQCAAGILLDADTLIHHPKLDEINTKLIQRVFDQFPSVVKPEYRDLDEEHIQFVRHLQIVHDLEVNKLTTRSWRQHWYKELMETARNYDLEWDWLVKIKNEHPEWEL